MPANTNPTVDAWFQKLDHPLKDAMQAGAVWLTRAGGTRRVRRGSSTARKGDGLHLYHDPRILAAEPPAATGAVRSPNGIAQKRCVCRCAAGRSGIGVNLLLAELFLA